MNLKLEQVASSKKYIIKDEKDNVHYICQKSVLSIGDKYIICDENNLQLAELKQTPLSKNLYKLYINGSVIDEICIHTRLPLKKYQLVNKKWIIGGDITYTNYTVLDEAYNKVLEMFQKSPSEPYTWEINLAETSEKLLAILVVTTILSLAQK